MKPVLLFSPQPHPLANSMVDDRVAIPGEIEQRRFPDGETYLRVVTPVEGCDCVVLHSLADPNCSYLPLLFLLDTLRELGARQVGLIAPYLAYMRQDCRFQDGEAVTSRLFAQSLGPHINWLLTVDPHLHRYRSLDEIYPVPARVVHAAPALADWLGGRDNLLLVGPDSESEQWVSDIAQRSGHPWVVGSKNRHGDREVEVVLPDLAEHAGRTAIIIDDVLSSGETVRQCAIALAAAGLVDIECAAVHAILAGDAESRLRVCGIRRIVTCNTIEHVSNAVDVGPLLRNPMLELLGRKEEE